MSHAKHDWVRAVVERIREASNSEDRDVSILMDLTGPSIRTGDVASTLHLKEGDQIEFRTDPAAPAELPLSVGGELPGARF